MFCTYTLYKDFYYNMITRNTNKIIFFLCLWAYNAKANEPKKETPLKIWFNQPAMKWDEGLPIGNGSLGAMIYGSPASETLCLNEETIWSGGKNYLTDRKDGYKYLGQIRQLLFDDKYIEAEKVAEGKLLNQRPDSGSNSYQMLANLHIESSQLVNLTNYKRQLDLNQALVSTLFQKQGVNYLRESFSSFPDQVMVFKYTADKGQKISFSAWVDRTANTKKVLSKNRIEFSEHVGDGFGVKFYAIADFEIKGGKSEVINGKLVISNADEVIIRVVASSDYRGLDPQQKCNNDLANALKLSYQTLLKRHIQDYQSLFNRVDIKLSDKNGEDIPTNVRLNQIKNGAIDNYLTQVEYQFGRYLLISSSRPGTLPANLQGIWVDGLKPAWNSDYHININIQMNYWLAEMTNLSECHLPFLDFIGDLRENGRITAKETYGATGFVAHHTSDLWYSTAGFGKSRYGMWPMGAAWCCEHLFTHYEYTEDKQFLVSYAYPIMKESAQFFVDFMVKDPKTGFLVSGPSVSPENNFITKNGEVGTITMDPTMNREIIFELFNNCIKSANILGIDASFRDSLITKLSQMQPIQIGSDGRLMEWAEEFKEKEIGHRHISHLYALHPSNQISKYKTPALFEAAKKTIETRLANGGGHTGWSRAWIINFYARLLEPEKAFQNIIALQQKSTLPNLLDLHPPFQIDGNFGLVSGITEMLMQSQNDEINVLPALPKEWSSGSINGLMAKKGFEVSIEWKNGVLRSLLIKSKLGDQLNLRYGDIVKSLSTKKRDILKFNSQMELL
ncbi:putative large secreted protein [Arcticibacter svalbardensis MN12-7]|uniref:Putative large secreted protein n=1 Tax=Arcticibacter svalbardensis MN12-7 TaxID=1150600 RepID=R9GQJ8_9SPHI|nr:glycoside hydrolase family 95 protein [Arcticibacter svalbardensis]EOR93815.1 putative large secreted protein [Arcticibacter svalbardensis MN12-7]